VSKFRLSGGLAGKICHVLIFVAIAMAAVAWSVKVLLVALLALGMIFILTFVMLWRLINLAHKSPQSALMEGAEFLLHEQLMVGTKNQPNMDISQEEVVESAPLELSASEKRTLNEPEEEPPIEISSGDAKKKGEE
jgi:hypothetical protein